MAWPGLREYHPTAMHPKTLEDHCRKDFPEWITSTRRALGSSETDPSTTPDTEKTPETVSAPAEMADENEPKDDVSEEDVEKDQQQQNPIRLDRRTILVRTLGVDIASVIFNHWTNENTRNCFNALCNIPGGTKVLKRIALMVPSLGNPTNISAQRSKVGGQPLKTFRASLEQASTEQPRQVIEKASN